MFKDWVVTYKLLSSYYNEQDPFKIYWQIIFQKTF